MSWFMSASTAADQSNFSFFFFSTNNNVSTIQFFHIMWISFYHTCDHLVFYLINCVNDFFHRSNTSVTLKLIAFANIILHHFQENSKQYRRKEIVFVKLKKINLKLGVDF